jgi:predicted RNA binding protein YcfA (HicA-like mRNA interferase family)
MIELFMSKRDKLRQKLRNNPTDATMQEVETLLTRFGFTMARIRGSHHIFEYEDGDIFRQVVVPLHGRKVKKHYVRRIVEILEELFPEDETVSEDEEDDEQNT